MRSVKTDGVVIPLRRGRDYFVGLQAIDKKQRNAKKKSEAAELRMLGKKLKAYENKAWLKAFVETLSRTMKLSKNRNIIPKPVSLLYSRMWMWYSSLGH